MVCTILMCCALLGADRDQAGVAAVAPADRTVYELAKKQAGRDADAHVRLALWCESHGLSSERMKHLALAVLSNPSHPLARGLMGQVAYQGKWGSPEEIGHRILTDPAYRELIREYLDRRAQAGHKADAQLRLASWCDQKGLKQQALAHYNEVVQIDPSREAAWRYLGFKKQGNRWVKAEEAAAAKLEAERQRLADKQWRPKLEKLRDDLNSKSPMRRAAAEQALTEVNDPRAVPMIWAVLLRGSERSQAAAVQLLGQIEGPAASNLLGTLAISCPNADVRRRASETLVRRDIRDILSQLIALIRKPFKYQVRPVNGPGSTGVLFVEGEKFNVRRLYRSTPIDPSLVPAGLAVLPAPFNPNGFANPSMADGATTDDSPNSPAPLARFQQGTGVDPTDYIASQIMSSGINSAENRDAVRRLRGVQQANQALQQGLAADVMAIETLNSQINQVNDRVLPIVKTATGQDLGIEPEKWKAWWTDQLGYAFKSDLPATKPTFSEIVDSPSWSASLECFGAGTLVRTVDGPRAIESIRVGDRVLTQNTSTGLLGFQPVLVVHRTKSAGTFRVDLDGETIVATGIHRFWKAGKGWAMARDLKPGDRIRMVGGIARVRSVEAGTTQPVFNLDVADNRNFFVGSQGVLVHDSNFVQPVLEPFDREPALIPAIASSK